MSNTYTKTAWVNGTTPYINAENLNKIEQGIENAIGQGNTNETAIDALETLLTPQTAEASFTGLFQNYSTGSNPHFIKIGRLCMVYGVAKPTEAIPGSATHQTMFTIPAGYIPVANLNYVCHGSYAKLWMFTIDTGGNATFSRLAAGADYTQTAGTAEWLPFNATYICAETNNG